MLPILFGCQLTFFEIEPLLCLSDSQLADLGLRAFFMSGSMSDSSNHGGLCFWVPVSEFETITLHENERSEFFLDGITDGMFSAKSETA